MPRLRVVVLETKDNGILQYVMWADVPIARQLMYASTGNRSAWKGALPSDQASLQAGQVVERVAVVNILPGMTLPVVMDQLQSEWSNFQAEVNATNSWRVYGSSWDGVTWASTGIV